MDPLPQCPTCHAPLEPGLPVCVACGRLFPYHQAEERALWVSRPPGGERASIIEPLLAGASGQSQESLAAQLDRGPVLFRLPASALLAEALCRELTDAGATVALEDQLPPLAALGAWARSLWRDRIALASLTAGLGLAVVAAAQSSKLFYLWLFAVGGLASLDSHRFNRRMTLSPTVLVRRLGLVPEELARPAGAVLRRARSTALPQALAAVLTEHARLLTAVTRVLRDHPALQGPFREALDQVSDHALRLAENAAAIEEASDPAGSDLSARLDSLRALGAEETNRQLHALVASRDERRTKVEWLRRAHALLLVRLESMAERLRALRHDTARRALELAPAPASDQLLAALGRELELALSAVTEVERNLPQPLPEVVAQLVGER